MKGPRATRASTARPGLHCPGTRAPAPDAELHCAALHGRTPFTIAAGRFDPPPPARSLHRFRVFTPHCHPALSSLNLVGGATDGSEKLAESEVSSGSQCGPACSSNSSGSRDMSSFKDADDAQKTVLVQAEMQRMKRHPVAGSAYAASRLNVLDKMLHLLGKVRTSTEGEELELLFANLNF